MSGKNIEENELNKVNSAAGESNCRAETRCEKNCGAEVGGSCGNSNTKHAHGHKEESCNTSDGCCVLSCSCGCGSESEDGEHDHGHEGGKFRVFIKYLIGAIPLAAAFVPALPYYARLTFAILVYIFFGFDVWQNMFRGFGRQRFFTEFTLMSIASVGAFAIGEFADGAAVMYLYTLGESISELAYSKSKRSISGLLKIVPDNVSVLRSGAVESTAVTDVLPGEVVIVRAGERIPLDGVVVSGGGFADSSSVTGESKPLELYPGIACPSGAVLKDGTVHVEVKGEYENSVAFGLQKAIEEASRRKSGTERKISKFAKYFTPLAFALALAVFAVGSLVTGRVSEWLRVGLTILVISCPCSLVLSVPLTYFAGIGHAAKKGIIFRGGEHMDGASRLSAVAFDKTGTLTESNLSFDGAITEDTSSQEYFLELAFDVLVHSPHAAAQAFCASYGGMVKNEVSDVVNIGGRGIACKVGGNLVLFGNAALLAEAGISVPATDKTVIYGASGGKYLGRLEFSSRLKPGAAAEIKRLAGNGVERVSVLSGDGERSVASVCREAGIPEFYAGLTPMDKLNKLEEIIKDEKSKNKKAVVAFCGDGLNDSAAIMRADLGIAMGKSGSALTVNTADVVLMDDDLAKINSAIEIGRRTSGIATQNIVISLGMKSGIFALIVLLTGVLGIPVSIELAVVADVGAAVVTVLNSLRVAKEK